jgi:hypothetical protein
VTGNWKKESMNWRKCCNERTDPREFSKTIHVTAPGDFMIASGGTRFEPFPESAVKDEFNMTAIVYSYIDSQGERGFVNSVTRYIDGDPGSRNMYMVNFSPYVGNPARPTADRVMLSLWVDASITPYSKGTLEHPGLPASPRARPGQWELPFLPVQSDGWYKLVLKVGPDAGAVSDGIRLDLKSVVNSEEISPQAGFTLQMATATGIVPLEVPVDGSIQVDKESAMYQSITSPDGLSLYLQKAPDADRIHRLSIVLLPTEKNLVSGPQRITALNLLPVEVVQGELGTETEDVGNWLMTEADPKPEVEMEITDAVVSGTDVVVTVQGAVTDRLSKFGETAAEKVQTLKFIVDGQELHSINVANGVEEGFDFNETITIPNAKPRGYTLRAETTENAAGNTGWDQVAVGLNLSPSTTTFPSPGPAFRIAFSQNPTNGQIDSAQVFFGDRGVQAGDLTVTETAADSYQFAGQVKVTIDGQQQSVPCQLAIRGPLTFATGAIDELTAEVSYTVPGLGENRLHGVWKESAANTLLFASSGYQAADETILVEAMVNLPGSQQEDFEPITMRINGPDDWEDSDTVKIKVGDTEYPLKKFTFDGNESLYPYDEAYPDEPKQFLPSAKSVPQKLQTPGYSAGGGSFDFKLKIDATAHDIQTVQVQRGFRDDFFAASPPVAAAQAAPGPLAMQAQAAQAGWKEPGDKVTMADLLTAYKWIYGTNEDAMTLLRAFQENGNIITLGDELNDLDVNYILRTDNKIEIEIEDDDNDVNPVVCANLLHAGLYQALAYPPLNNHQEVADNINLFVASRTAFAQTAAEITSTAAEMYLSGITIISEPLDWVLVFSDVSEGNYASLAGALPFVPVSAVRTGGKIVFRTQGGRALGEIANQGQLDAIHRAARKRSFEDKVAILEEAGLSDDVIDFLVRGGEIEYSKARAVLKSRMKRAGLEPPSGSHQAHHDLPWEFREWFAAHKIDVNDAAYGRWVHIDDHKTWHNENPKFNDVWEDFIYDANGNQLRRSKDEIIAKLNEIKASYTTTK